MEESSPISVASKLVLVGLGNPGPQYRHTRHNLGFVVVDELARALGVDSWRAVKLAEVAETRVGDCRLTLVKPQTFMNRSGQAVKEVLGGVPPSAASLWVIYDDAEIKLGSWRVRLGGSHGGHNGIRSLLDSLGSPDFGRVRVGIGPVPDVLEEEARTRDLDKFVLAPFLPSERPRAAKVVDSVVAYLVESIRSGSLEPSTHYYQEQ